MPTRTVQPVSNPYAGGAIVADFTPYLNLALQQKAKEEAKAAAAQKVFDDMMKDPNPKGIRQQDTQGFYDKTNDWRTFGIQNKKEITNPTLDGGKALLEFRRKVADITGYINSSLDAKERDKQFAPIFADPEKSKMITTSFMNEYQQFQKPLNLGGGGVIDVNKIFGAKPLDEKKAIDYLVAGLKPSEGMPEYTAIPGDQFSRREFVTKKYDPTALENKAKDLYRTDESFKATIDNLWKESGMKINPNGTITPPTGYVADLQKIYVDDKGKPKPIQTKDDLAAAWAISKLPAWKEGKTVRNIGAELAARESSALRLAKAKAKIGTQEQANYVEKHMADIENAKDTNQHYFVQNNKIVGTERGIPLSPIEQRAFTFQEGNLKIQPDALTIIKSKTGKKEDDVYKVIVYKVYTQAEQDKATADKAGQTEVVVGKVVKKDGLPVIDEAKTRKFTRKQAKANLAGTLFSGKQEYGELTGGGSSADDL